jgi:hypothetical protein
MMNVMTDSGVVILARVDANWVLGVLFQPEETLGMALQKCRDVVRLLGEVTLPPPPKAVEPIIEIEEKGLSTQVIDSSEELTEETSPFQSAGADAALEMEEFEEIPLEDIEVVHGCIVFKGPRFEAATNMGSSLNTEIIDTFSHLAVDILFMVDEERTVFKIAESLGRQVERVIEVVKYCVSKGIAKVECPEEQESGRREIVELPLYEGNLSKAKKEHRAVLELCDGTRTVHEIADHLGILYFNALQSIVPYRGKTLRFVRKDIQVDD